MTNYAKWQDLREQYGVQLCDKRRTRSYIEKRFGKSLGLTFEKGFTEEDLLWKPDERETDDHIKERVRRVLNVIFENDELCESVTLSCGGPI